MKTTITQKLVTAYQKKAKAGELPSLSRSTTVT